MLFNSYYFVLFFLPLTWLGYFGLNAIGKYKGAQAFLVAASLFFYGYYNWYYLAVICISILVNYGIAKIVGGGVLQKSKTYLDSWAVF